MSRKWWSDDRASASTLGFLVALGVVTSSIFVVFQASVDLGSSDVISEAAEVNLQSEAASLRWIILDSPGVMDSGQAWDESSDPTADDLVRLGLLDPDRDVIQVEKLNNLRLAPYAANDSDGYVNYEEAATGLGLEDKGLAFHIRAKPTFTNIEAILSDPEQRDPNLRVTYIANVTSTTTLGGGIDDGLEVEDLRCGASPTGSPSWRFSVDIKNGGSTPTQFTVVMEINGDQTVTRQDQSEVAAVGDTVTVHVDVENIDGFTCDDSTTVDLDILDPLQLLGSISSSVDVGTAPADADAEFYMEVEAPNSILLDDVRLDYFGDMEASDVLSLEVREGITTTGAVVYTTAALVPADPEDRYVEIPGLSLAVGDYTAYLTHADSGVVTTQHFTVNLADVGAYTPLTALGPIIYEEDPAVALEVEYLTRLMINFCPTYYDDATDSPIGADWDSYCQEFKNLTDPAVLASQPGDIFPDLKPDMRELDERLLDSNGDPRYDIVNTLVIGSNVAHNVMVEKKIREPIEDWVLGGGTLIVFGSPDQGTGWLKSLFKVGQDSSSSGITEPDPSHSILSTPSLLSFEEYTPIAQGWSYVHGAEDYFTDVIREDGVPITAVSEPGDFGEGSIVLTSWGPYDLFGEGAGSADEEGIRLMHNLLSPLYADLYLDYGPPIPSGLSVVPATGRGLVDHPELGLVTMDFTFYVFPA